MPILLYCAVPRIPAGCITMKIVVTILRFLLALLMGFIGCIVLLMAPYQMANINFTWADGGPFVFITLVLGTLILWATWRLLRSTLTYSRET